MKKLLFKYLEAYKDLRRNVQINNRKEALTKAKDKKDIESLRKSTLKFLNDYQKSIEKNNSKSKETIYKEIRKLKLKKNELIIIKGDKLKQDIEIDTTKESFITRLMKKIPFLSKTDTFLNKYKVFMIGYKGVCDIIELTKLEDNSLDTTENEIYLLNKLNSTGEKANINYTLGGKNLLFLNKDTLISPEFDDKGNKFIYDIKPRYFFNLIDNVIDSKLAIIGKGEGLSGIAGIISKYWLLMLLAGVVYVAFEKGLI